MRPVDGDAFMAHLAKVHERWSDYRTMAMINLSLSLMEILRKQFATEVGDHKNMAKRMFLDIRKELHQSLERKQKLP